jgi:hypothetical protein
MRNAVHHECCSAYMALSTTRGLSAGPKMAEVGGEGQAKNVKFTDIDQPANEVATSPTTNRPELTPAQHEAGNSQKGHIRRGELDISIENPAGGERRRKPGMKPAWSVTMKSHYG